MKKGDTPAQNRIDKKIFENLCFLQCTESEIAGVFDVDEDTLETWIKKTYNMRFSEVFKRKSASGKMSVRRAQFRLAENNATMAIWLGKQYLGQTDKVENQVDIQGIEIVADIPSKEDE